MNLRVASMKIRDVTNQSNSSCRVKHFKKLSLPIPIVIHRCVHRHSTCWQINDNSLAVVSIEIKT